MSDIHILLSNLFLLIFLLYIPFIPIFATAMEGKWDLLHSNIGIVAMHVQLLHTDRVLIFDRTDYGLSNISLPKGKCRHDPNEKVVKVDCTAHSIEYDVKTNSIRPLMVQTDVWCSSGAAMSDGTVVQTGGYRDGDHKIRRYKPCKDNSCDWKELGAGLVQRRWYASNHVLPDGKRQIIFGGRRQFSYEFHPKSSKTEGVYNFPFLAQTNDFGIENNLYPFIFLNKDGNLFIFANNRAILFDYMKNAVVRTYPTITGGESRNYPSTGSAVLLMLSTNNLGAEVLVCGGAPIGSFASANLGTFVKALDTCGRIEINDPNPKWEMETMPMHRVMGDMVMLPNGHVLIVNGAGSGTAGWEVGRDPVLSPVLYRTYNPIGSRFEVQNPTSIPRMYHSTATLLRDGRVLVSGSNPHERYKFSNVLFPTDLTMETFSPSYLDQRFKNLRPQIISPASQSKIRYGQRLVVRFKIPTILKFDEASVKVTMVAPSFTTHSFGMNQRLLVLDGGNVTAVARFTYKAHTVTPPSGYYAPAGYYLLYVVYNDLPSEGIWVRIHEYRLYCKHFFD